jgi:hypothetical protein
METITISLDEVVRLKERDDWLSCLEEAGVDNWEGISHAYEIKEEND